MFYAEVPSWTPPRGPAADRRPNNSGDGPPSGPREMRQDRQGRGRGDPRRTSPSPPRRARGRSGYRDRDREGYRSPKYGSRSRSVSPSYSRSRSRSRSPRGRRPPHYGPESREVMMEGLPMDMKEDDVRQLLFPFLILAYFPEQVTPRALQGFVTSAKPTC